MTNYKGAFPTILHRKCSWLTVPHANFSLKIIIYACALVKAMLFFVCKFDHLLIAKACKGKLRRYVFKREGRPIEANVSGTKTSGAWLAIEWGNSSILHLRQSWHGFLSFVLRLFSKSFFFCLPSMYFCVFIWRTCRLCFAREPLHLEASSWPVLFPRRTASHPAWFDVAWNAQRKPPTP